MAVLDRNTVPGLAGQGRVVKRAERNVRTTVAFQDPVEVD